MDVKCAQFCIESETHKTEAASLLLHVVSLSQPLWGLAGTDLAAGGLLVLRNVLR